MDLLFANSRKNTALNFLKEHADEGRVRFTYEILGEAIGCSRQHARKIILSLQKENYIEIISSSYGTLIEIKK